VTVIAAGRQLFAARGFSCARNDMTTNSIGFNVSAPSTGNSQNGSANNVDSSEQGLFDSLVQELQQTAGTETTTTTSDGGSVTTVGTGPNAKVVSETMPNGATVTEAGYVSPVLLQRFLGSLFEALQSNGLTSGDAAAATAGGSAPVTNTGSSSDGTMLASVQTLIQQLGPNEPNNPNTSSLLTSFDNLMEGSGLANPGQATKTALQAFLNNALPDLQNGSVGPAGINLKATA
jgi:hypothetical protein